MDPHGDFAINNLWFIPESRARDVVYFNPADEWANKAREGAELDA